MKTLILSALLVIGCDNSSVKNNVRPMDVPVEYHVQPNLSLGGMSVNFPQPSQWKSEEIYIPSFGNVVSHIMMNVNDTEGYVVAWVDYPIPQTTLSKLSNSDIQGVLMGGRDGGVSSVNGKLVWDQESNLSGVPGREFSCVASIQGMKFIIHAKIFLKGNRLFQFMSIRLLNNKLNDESFFSSISVQ